MSLPWNPANHHVRPRLPRLNVTMESRIESADLAESMIVEFASRSGCGERECEEIGLAVRESVVNAVLHGNRCDLSKKVVLTAELDEDGLLISVKDEGEGFDPDSLPDPLISDNLLHETGRGFFILKTCMDDVAVRRAPSHGTVLTMVKRLVKDQMLPRRFLK